MEGLGFSVAKNQYATQGAQGQQPQVEHTASRFLLKLLELDLSSYICSIYMYIYIYICIHISFLPSYNCIHNMPSHIICTI